MHETAPIVMLKGDSSATLGLLVISYELVVPVVRFCLGPSFNLEKSRDVKVFRYRPLLGA